MYNYNIIVETRIMYKHIHNKNDYTMKIQRKYNTEDK